MVNQEIRQSYAALYEEYFTPLFRYVFFRTKDTNTAKAKSDCANGVEESVARESFKAGIKSAREEFSAFRGDEIKSQIKALAEARKTSVENAVNTFKATMEDARDDLKTAFGENN